MQLLIPLKKDQTPLQVLSEDEEPEKKTSRLRVLVESSRTVYGVADPTQQLEYGQCFFQPTIDSEPQSIAGGTVAVVRSLLQAYIMTYFVDNTFDFDLD